MNNHIKKETSYKDAGVNIEKGNELVNEVIIFIEKDKKRPICSPQS